MKQGKSTPFAQRYAALAPVVDRTFALPTILQSVVGPRWSSIPADQQSALLAEFRRFTIASYTANFDSFGGERIELLPQTRAVGAEQVVETQIVPANGSPQRIDYLMRQTGDGWRAVDVLLDGSISNAAVQRSDFRSLLQSGSAEPLIASLRKKVSDLSGGATLP